MEVILMMNLNDVKKAYEDLSGILSSVARQLNFAGIAIVWIFANEKLEGIDSLLMKASLWFVLSLSLDLFQYIFQSFFWYVIYVFKHKKSISDESVEVKDSEWWNALPWLILLVKVVFLVVGFIYLLRFLFDKM